MKRRIRRELSKVIPRKEGFMSNSLRSTNKHRIHCFIPIRILVPNVFTSPNVPFVSSIGCFPSFDKRAVDLVFFFSSVSYAELTFEFQHNHSDLFDDLHTMKGICKLEWSLRAYYTNCSGNASCCYLIGPGKQVPLPLIEEMIDCILSSESVLP